MRCSESAEVITIVSLGCYESWMCELVQCTGNYSSPAGPHVNKQWVEDPKLPPSVKHLPAAISLGLGIELRTKNGFSYNTPCVCFVGRSWSFSWPGTADPDAVEYGLRSRDIGLWTVLRFLQSEEVTANDYRTVRTVLTVRPLLHL